GLAGFPVRQHDLAFVEDACATRSAYGGIERRVDRRNRRLFGLAHVIAADRVDEAAAFEDLVDLRFQVGEPQRDARLAQPALLVTEQLGTGGIDEVDAAADQEHVPDGGSTSAGGVQFLAHVIDGAEEQRAVDAQDLELWA